MKALQTNKILTVVLVMQWAFVKLIGQYPDYVERFYSNQFYLLISRVLRFLFGWIPFSIGDLLYFFIGVALVRVLYLFFKHKNWQWKVLIFRLGAWCSILFFLFHLNWGLNYHRNTLPEQLGIDAKKYTTEELIVFTNQLIEKSNAVHLSLSKNDTLLYLPAEDKKAFKKMGPDAYEQLAEVYPQYTYASTSVKHSLFSLPLTYMGFAGYLNPLTNEAQVNSMIPISSYPATLCHEIAHQVGIGSESEANFVGFLASIYADNTYYNYSGYLMALRYCISEIYKREPDYYKTAMDAINPGIIKEFKESRKFWMKYQNFSEKHFKSMYDSYLKANKQREGIDSYNHMVGLLINFYKGKSL